MGAAGRLLGQGIWHGLQVHRTDATLETVSFVGGVVVVVVVFVVVVVVVVVVWVGLAFVKFVNRRSGNSGFESHVIVFNVVFLVVLFLFV